MARQQVEATGTTGAAPELVWSLVADATSYPAWGPWEDGGYEPASTGPSQPGMVQWFRYDKRTTTTEKILEVEEPRRVAYTVVGGLPVKDYRADVVITPGPGGGTSIRWSASWKGTLLGRLVRCRLGRVYNEVMAGLVAAADRKATDTAN